jgi:hypothetical protein
MPTKVGIHDFFLNAMPAKVGIHDFFLNVMPTKVGIHDFFLRRAAKSWMAAFARDDRKGASMTQAFGGLA